MQRATADGSAAVSGRHTGALRPGELLALAWEQLIDQLRNLLVSVDELIHVAATARRVVGRFSSRLAVVIDGDIARMRSASTRQGRRKQFLRSLCSFGIK